MADRREDGFDRVRFIYEWFNKSDATVEIDAFGVIAAAGLFDLKVDGGFFGHWGWMFAYAQLEVGERRTELVLHDSWMLRGHIMAFNNPIVPFDGDATGFTHGEFTLQALRHPIGPGKFARIEVSLLIHTDCEHGLRANADFESGPLGASCPLVLIRVHGMKGPLQPATPGAVKAATRR